MKPVLALLVAAILVAAPAPAVAQRVIHVDTDATGANDGTSWADAFVFLQDALAVAQDGDEVWAAEGVYRPDQGTGVMTGDRQASFVLAQGVALRGGFAGTEVLLADRLYGEHESVLSGDLLGNDLVGNPPVPGSSEYADNSNGILYTSDRVRGLVASLDRLTIRGSRGDRPALAGTTCVLVNLRIVENLAERSVGAARIHECEVDSVVFARNRNSGFRAGALIVGNSVSGRDTVIRNSRFVDNGGAYQGGALWVDGYAPTIVSGSVFIGNEAWDGGAIFAHDRAELTIVATRFFSNHATCSGGGLVAVEGAHVTVVNSLFASNVAEGECNEMRGGGAGLVYDATLEVLNSTLVDNHAPTGGDVLIAYDAVARLVNSVVWENAAGTEDFQAEDYFQAGDATIELAYVLHDEALSPGVTAIGPLIQAAARFVDPEGPDGMRGTEDDDYRQLADSPGVDAGESALLPPDVADLDGDGDRSEPTPYDLDRNPRVAGSGEPELDLGALERVGSTRAQPREVADTGTSRCTIQAYPNPFRSSLTLAVTGQASATLQVFDSIGRRVTSRPPVVHSGVSPRVRLRTEAWGSGVYLIIATTPSGTCRAAAMRVQ